MTNVLGAGHALSGTGLQRSKVSEIRSRQASLVRGRCVVSTPNAVLTPVSTPNSSQRTKPEVAKSYVTKEARKGLFGRASEHLLESEAQVVGTLPKWLRGSLLANGGADYRGMKHMFDGYAMICKVRFEGGKVYGSQRYVDSKAYRHFEATGGEMLFREFATTVPSPLPDIFNMAAEAAKLVGRMATGQEAFTDNASVNVVPLPDNTFLAVSESRTSVYRMDSTSLKTLKRQDYNDKVTGDLTTAHPKVMSDGTLVNFTRSLPMGGYHVYKLDPVSLIRTQIAFIPDRNGSAPCWVHDFAITENYAVIVETPAPINLGGLMFGSGAEYCGYLDWKPEEGTRVYVVPLNGREGLGDTDKGVLTFAAPPFFFFHAANAFEENGEIFVDLATYDTPQILRDLNLASLMEFPGKEVSKSSLRRLKLSLPPSSLPPGSSPSTTPAPPLLLSAGLPKSILKDESKAGFFSEFNSVNPTKRGRRHRYVWGVCATRPTNMGNSLIKIDTKSGESIVWHESGCLPGEPSFIPSPLPAPQGTAASSLDEDDGVLISLVMSGSGTSFVLVLDAISMKELGRAPLSYAVPYRFHGAFVPAH